MEGLLSKRKKEKKKRGMDIEGLKIEGISIAGHETCIAIKSMNLLFDIGRCPHFAPSHQFLFISHGHMDHILDFKHHLLNLFDFKQESFWKGGLPMYVATRGLHNMAPPTIIIPSCIRENVEKLFEAHRGMDQSELEHNLICLNVGEDFYLRKDLKVKAFKTYHRIQSQGYIVYSVKQKLKQAYIGLPGTEIKNLKSSGVEITDTITVPEVAFTGDTMSDFIIDEDNSDVLRSKVLIMESTYVTDLGTVANARDHGHIHLSEIIGHADRFQNKAILLIHFSARYQADEIQNAMSTLPPSLVGRVFTLLEGF